MRTLRALRAIVWLRWRLLKNSLTGSRKRDTLEQMSRALALVVPLIIVALSVGTFVTVSVVGFIAGSMLADGRLGPAPTLLVVRLMVGLMAFTILVLALVSPTQSSLSRYTRLLLLPIQRRVLHLVEVVASLADPWMAVLAAGLTMLAVGLVAGGEAAVGMAALAAAALTVAAVVSGASLAGFLVAWLMRDRRRGELFTLVFVMVISLASFVPAVFSGSLEEETRSPRDGTKQRRSIGPDELDRRLPAWSRYLPSEVHGRTVRAALDGNSGAVAVGLGLLAGEAMLLFLASAFVHRRMLDSLEGDQSRRRRKDVVFGNPTLPLLTPPASAVALATIRGSFRTVRGRLTILLPGPMLGMMTAVFKTVPQETWAAGAARYGFLLFGAMTVFTFYAMQAISMNLFGSDRAGLTLQLLSPVSDRQLAWGKVAGMAILTAAGLAVALPIALIVATPVMPAYWIAVCLGAVATFFLLAPLWILFSALFPVAADLSKTGAAGNPHPLPMFAGLLCTALFSAPTLGILGIAHFWLESPIAAVGLAIVWLGVAVGVGIPLVNAASRVIRTRRENLALVGQGR
jgi:hypothetical protein